MPCKNPSCPRQSLDELELMRLTAQQLRQTEYPSEITSKLGSFVSCAHCANEMLAAWIDELRWFKSLRYK